MPNLPSSPPTDFNSGADPCAFIIPKPVFKKFAAVVAGCAWGAVALQLAISFPLLFAQGHSWSAALLKPFTFFTICTNLLVAVFYTGRAMRWNRFRQPRVWAVIEAGLLVNILFVAIAFQAMGLRAYRQVTGIEIISELFLHYLNPLLVLFHWLTFRERGQLRIYDQIWWLGYLFIYEIAVIAYGHIWKTYPYPGFNAIKIGYPQLVLNSLFLLSFWMILAFSIICFDRFRGLRKVSRV